MQFEVNGQNYFLHFSPEENDWVLFRPAGEGVEQMEIAHDTGRPEFRGVMIPFSGNDRGTVN